MASPYLNSRVVELVRELDRVVPVEGAQAIICVELFWQTFPRVERYEQYTPFLATPTGFVRFGIEYMKAALAAPTGAGSRGELVDCDVEYILRQDSNLEVSCERVTRDATTPRRDARQGPFDWSAASAAGPGWAPLLRELDTLIAPAEAEMTMEALAGEQVIQIVANAAGLLRFGLEFAKLGVVPDLDYIAGEKDLRFECERVPALPPGGLRHGGTEVPGIVVLGILVTVGMLLLRACLVSR